MLVKELIKKLEQFNQEEDIRFHCSITNEGGVSICRDGEIGIDHIDNIDWETGNDIEDGPAQILVLYINGEETYSN